MKQGFAPGHANAPAGPRQQTVWWVLAVLLAFIAGTLWKGSGGGENAAFAQQPPMAGARGVYAFTGQLEDNRFGLFMLDIEQGTIWCYELDSGSGGARKLRLVAGRSWIYDRYLKNFNCATPDWRMVQQLVAQERAQADAQSNPAATLLDEKNAKKEDHSDHRGDN